MPDIPYTSQLVSSTRLTALRPGLPGWDRTRKVKTICHIDVIYGGYDNK